MRLGAGDTEERPWGGTAGVANTLGSQPALGRRSGPAGLAVEMSFEV